MKRLRVAVVGLGVGRGHLQAYANLPEHYEIKALCDLDHDKLRTAASDFSVVTTTKDLTSLLQNNEIDLIDLCTPPNTHLTLLRQCLAAGKHVVGEKPLVGSLAELDQLEIACRQAASATGSQVFPIFQYRFGNGLQKLRHLRRKGLAQHALLTVIETHWRREANYYAVPWRGKWASEMGGVCLTQAIHAHDFVPYVLGSVKAVSAHLATRVNDIEGEDCAAISLVMQDGSLAVFSATLGAAQESSRVKFIFNDMTAESFSPDHYRPGRDPWQFIGKNNVVNTEITDALNDFEPSHESFEGQFVSIYNSVVHGAAPAVTVADARSALELITAIYYSAETGQQVKLPITSAHPRYQNWAPATGGFAKGLATHG
jgi:predicted dehydrogenase